MPGKPFEKGHKLAKGGARKGAGRKPNWYKALAEKLIREKKLLPRLADMAAGAPIVKKQIIVGEGKDAKRITLKSAADAGTQVYAADKLFDRAWGKAAQEVQHTGKEGVDIFDLIRRAEDERGLPRSFDD